MHYSIATGLVVAVPGVTINHPDAFGGIRQGRALLNHVRGKRAAVKSPGKTARKRANMPDRKQKRDERRAERNLYTGAYKIH